MLKVKRKIEKNSQKLNASVTEEIGTWVSDFQEHHFKILIQNDVKNRKRKKCPIIP